MIVSADKFNKGPADLVIAIPITRTSRDIASHILVAAGEAGLESDSYIMVEAIRSISKERLLHYRGDLPYTTIESVEHIVRVLLRRKAKLRRAGEAFYMASAARLAERTATTGRHLATAGSSSLVQSPLTRYCARCRKNVPIVAVYCTRCGRKFDA